MEYVIRCNMCERIFEEEGDLVVMKDKYGYFQGCPDCETDGYLMDIPKTKMEAM